MKDKDLQRRLNGLPTPQASDVARERARHRALIAFQQRTSRRPKATGQMGGVWRWRGVVAVALIIGCLPLLVPRHHSAPENLADDRKILDQVAKLFPNQVDAVVQRNGKTDLSLTDSSTLGSDQPVVVVFQRGKESIRVLSYSGHHVCLDLGNVHSCFEILETPNGGVILESDKGAWLSAQHPVVDGYSVRAHVLEASL